MFSLESVKEVDRKEMNQLRVIEWNRKCNLQAFARPTVPQADLPEVARNFEASLSHDDAIESVPSGESTKKLLILLV